jgi:hypothetical protein
LTVGRTCSPPRRDNAGCAAGEIRAARKALWDGEVGIAEFEPALESELYLLSPALPVQSMLATELETRIARAFV